MIHGNLFGMYARRVVSFIYSQLCQFMKVSKKVLNWIALHGITAISV